MPDNDKTPYEQLLEVIDNIKQENAKLRKEFEEVRDFNRALLSRRSKDNDTLPNGMDKDLSEKYNKFLKGE